MGKITKFHPVSLHVIRGAAEYCGFRFEKVHQLHSFPEKNSARYNVTIVDFPKGWDQMSLDLMQSVLQDCFLDDIRVHWLRKNRLDQWMCHLQVDVIREPAGGGGGGGGPDDDWDGLRVCSICEDRYTTEDICHVCAQQIAIDNDHRPQTYWCRQCGQYQARWEGALCLTCWLKSRQPAGGGGGGGGGAPFMGEIMRCDVCKRVQKSYPNFESQWTMAFVDGGKRIYWCPKCFGIPDPAPEYCRRKGHDPENGKCMRCGQAV